MSRLVPFPQASKASRFISTPTTRHKTLDLLASYGLELRRVFEILGCEREDLLDVASRILDMMIPQASKYSV
jgi:hypothetical protein